MLNLILSDKASFEFDGIGFAVNGEARKKGKEDYTFKVEMSIDGKAVETSNLPTNFVTRKYTPFWKYQLPPGKHHVEFIVQNPTDQAEIELTTAIIYADKLFVPTY
jgi:hypothetical protein